MREGRAGKEGVGWVRGHCASGRIVEARLNGARAGKVSAQQG